MADFTNRNADETKQFILTFDENGGSPEYTKIEDANGVDRTAEVVELLGINDKEDADPTILKEGDVEDSLNSTSTTKPLSANQGKQLNDDKASLSALGSIAGQDSDDVDITGGNAVFNNLQRGSLQFYDFESETLNRNNSHVFSIDHSGGSGISNGKYLRVFATWSSNNRTSLCEFFFIRRGSESGGQLSTIVNSNESFSANFSISNNTSESRIEITLSSHSGADGRLKMFFMSNFDATVTKTT